MRRLISSLVACGVMMAATPASAAKVEGPAELIVLLIVGDVVLFVGDLRTSPVSRGYAVGETLMATPQALVFGGATVAMVVDSPGPEAAMISASLATFTGALATHGMWSWANGAKSSRDALGVSLLASLDGVFLATAITADVAGRARSFAMPSIVAGAPATLASAIGLALDRDHRSGWIALTSASFALLAHGVTVKLLAPEPKAPPQARFGPIWLASADRRGSVGFGWSGAW